MSDPETHLHILFPRVRPNGALEGTVQLVANDILTYERTAVLSSPATLAEIAAALSEQGVEHAEAELLRLITEARGNLAEEAEADKLVRPTPSKFLRDAQSVLNQLEDEGRFLRTPAGRYYFSTTARVPVEIQSWDMSYLLWAKFQINPQEDVVKYVTSHLDFHAHRAGQAVDVRRFSYYEAEANVLYLDRGAGRMLRITADGIEDIANGEDGILFFPTAYQCPWVYRPLDLAEWRIEPELVAGLSFQSGAESPMTPANQRLLFLLWLNSMFFRSELPTRPIALFVGDTGSGKSVAARIVGRILYGPTFEVDQLRGDKEDDFWATVTNRPFVVYDNVDTRVRWLEDALATCATGVQRTMRRYYTTNEEVQYSPDTFLALTARTPRIRRPDVSGRLLFFYMEPRQLLDLPVRRERVLYEEVARRRDLYMSELAERCRLVLVVQPEEPETSPLRLADFYAVALRVGISLGLEPETREVLDRLRGAQSGFSAEENPLLLTIEAWLPGMVDGVPNATRELPARVLFSELSRVAAHYGYRWFYSNELEMGHALRELHDSTEGRFVVERRRAGGKGTVYRIQPADWAEEQRLL